MEIGDWITLFAVIVALFIGVSSILHTRSMQKKERKERLLNEIIEWAIDLRNSYLGKEFEIISIRGDNITTAYHFNLTQLYNKGKYINNICSIFSKSLKDITQIAMNTLHICIGLNLSDDATLKSRQVENTRESRDKEFLKCLLELQDLAEKIINEATTIKTNIFVLKNHNIIM